MNIAIFKLLIPFGFLLIFLIFIPLYFFHWAVLCIGALISCLILLFEAIKYELVPIPYTRKFKKVAKNDTEYQKKQEEFYKTIDTRVDTRIHYSFRTAHTESAQVLNHIFPIIKNKYEVESKKIKLQLITLGGMDVFKEEIGKFDTVMKQNIEDAIEKGYLECFVTEKEDQKHFSITDKGDVLVQEWHKRNDCKDMIYVEDSAYLGRKYSNIFTKLKDVSYQINKEIFKKIVEEQ